MEHWLPLFLARSGAADPVSALTPCWTLDHQFEEAKDPRGWETIADFYQARHDLQRAEGRESGAAP